MITSIRRHILALGLLLLAAPIASAVPGDENWSTTFAPRGTNGEVRVTLERGSDLIVGGDFTQAGPVAASRIAVWNGTSWSALGDGFNGPVEALFEWNGDIYAGGSFSASGATPLSNLARWTGSAWVDVGGGTDDTVRTMAVYNAKLYVGGWFYTAGAGAGQVSTEGIASWDGAGWSNLSANFNSNFAINDLQVHNGDLYVAGSFPYTPGLNSPHLCRYNGSSWFGVGNGLTYVEEFGSSPENAEAYELAVSGGSLFVSGSFNESGQGLPLDGLATWNGSSWSDPGFFTGYGYIPAMGVVGGLLHIIEPDGNLWRKDGGSWSFLATGAWSVGGYSSTIGNYGADVVVGGSFTGFGGRYIDNIARYDGVVHGLGSGQGIDDYAYRLLGRGGRLLAAGRFENAGGVDGTFKIADWDGTDWTSLGVSAMLPYGSAIHSAVEFGGDLIVGGGFTSIAGVSASRVARYDGSNWHAMGTGSFGNVTELFVWNAQLHARVELTSGVPSISRWTGTAWSPIGNNLFGGDIYRMGDYNGKLIIAGQATSVAGVTINGIAGWDGASWSPLGSGVAGPLGPRIYGMLIQDGLIYVAGYFTSVGGVPAAYLATWNGTSWSQFGGGANSVCYDIRSYNGEIYVTGAFTTIGGVAANGIARWDGTAWHALGSGLAGVGNTLGEYDGRLYVSGNFASAGGAPAASLASWSAGVTSAAPETRIALGPRAAPNPFGGTTSLFFELSRDRQVVVEVYDIRGHRVARLHQGQMQAGRNVVTWNGTDGSGQRQPAGTYFIRTRSGEGATTTKVNLIR